MSFTGSKAMATAIPSWFSILEGKPSQIWLEGDDQKSRWIFLQRILVEMDPDSGSYVPAPPTGVAVSVHNIWPRHCRYFTGETVRCTKNTPDCRLCFSERSAQVEKRREVTAAEEFRHLRRLVDEATVEASKSTSAAEASDGPQRSKAKQDLAEIRAIHAAKYQQYKKAKAAGAVNAADAAERAVEADKAKRGADMLAQQMAKLGITPQEISSNGLSPEANEFHLAGPKGKRPATAFSEDAQRRQDYASKIVIVNGTTERPQKNESTSYMAPWTQRQLEEEDGLQDYLKNTKRSRERDSKIMKDTLRKNRVRLPGNGRASRYYRYSPY